MAYKSKTNPENRWYLRWRHYCAYVFLTTIIFDFIIMPIIFMSVHKVDPATAVALSLQFKDPASRVAIATILLSKETWQPITLGGNGIFFIAFGSILSVASWTRGAERLAFVKNNLNQPEEVDDSSDSENTTPDNLDLKAKKNG